MTYRELAEKIMALPADQQAQKVAFMGADRPGGDISGIWVAEEDHVNPSGDGDEPISVYKDDPDFIADEEPVTIAAGTVLMLEEG